MCSDLTRSAGNQQSRAAEREALRPCQLPRLTPHRSRPLGILSIIKGQQAMATMYCTLCEQSVEAQRQIGVGTLILSVLTGGLWLLAIPCYQERCPICKSTALSKIPTKLSSSRTCPRELIKRAG